MNRIIRVSDSIAWEEYLGPVDRCRMRDYRRLYRRGRRKPRRAWR